MGLGSTLAQESDIRARAVTPPRAIKLAGWHYRDPKKPLTPRLLDLYNLVAEGLSNSECAERMGLTEGSVKTMVTVLFKALDIHSRECLILHHHRQALRKWLLRYQKSLPIEAVHELADMIGPTMPERWLD